MYASARPIYDAATRGTTTRPIGIELMATGAKGSRMAKADRDIEKDYKLPDFIAKLRRLADALESKQRFEIRIAGERISIPVRATYNIEHERGDGEEEIEFQIKWTTR
jgi:amphi-Trp domain-containing protein